MIDGVAWGTGNANNFVNESRATSEHLEIGREGGGRAVGCKIGDAQSARRMKRGLRGGK